MTKFELLVGLNMVSGIGSVRLRKLLEYFPEPADVLNASQKELMFTCGLSQKAAAQVCSLKKVDLAGEFASVKKHGLTIITQDDARYPDNLRQIPAPPIVLYVLGELRGSDKLSIGVVGSRRASYYGLSLAEQFSLELALSGLTIVSGLARGVDTASHNGALKSGGRTIAVMGSGFGHIYPPENKKLAKRISEHGAVISEFAMDTRPFRENFPRRNRIVSGLSLGVLVVEAARNSGALITADFALEQGREVFALPGAVNSPNAFGTNELIKQGAKLVSSKEDVLEGLNLFLATGVPQENRGLDPADDFSDEERILYDLISAQPLFLDEILGKVSLAMPLAYELLLKLQMKKLIKQLPGKRFVRANQAL